MAVRLGLKVNNVRIFLDPLRENNAENIWSGTWKLM